MGCLFLFSVVVNFYVRVRCVFMTWVFCFYLVLFCIVLLLSAALLLVMVMMAVAARWTALEAGGET